MRHKPWVFLLVYCTPIDNPRTGFSLRLCLPKELELVLKKCCHLVAISSKNNFKTSSQGLLLFKRPEVVNDTCP